jgi:amidase
MASLFQLTTQRLALQEAWLKYWASTASMTKSRRPVDAILCPAQASVPRTHDTLIRSHFSRNFNNLDYPAAVIQCGHVDLAKDDVELPSPKGPADEKVQSLCECLPSLHLFTYSSTLHIGGKKYR